MLRNGVPLLAATWIALWASWPSAEPSVARSEAATAAVETVARSGAETASEATTAPAPAPPAPAAEAAPSPPLAVSEGEATYYADVLEGRPMASGETFRQSDMIAAHREYPFGTRLRVTNLGNGREVVVRVMDRGPFAPGHRAPAILDLSKSAARELRFVRHGRTMVRAEVLEWGSGG